MDVKDELIIAEYEKADSAGRKILVTLCGEGMFVHKITDSILAFEESCKKEGIKPSDLLRFSNPINAYQEGKNAEDMLDQLYKDEVGDFEPNWNEGNVKKWIPVFIMGAAFRFNFANYGWTYTRAYGGSRLWFPTDKMAADFGKKHESLYKKVANTGKRK